MFVAKFFEGRVPGATAAGQAEAEELGKVVGPKVRRGEALTGAQGLRA